MNNKINFWLRNKYFINIKSSNLIIKNLNKIFYNIKIEKIKNFRFVKFPNITAFILLKYIFSKYLKNFLIKTYNKLFILEKPLWKIFTKDLNSNSIIYDKNILSGSKNIHPNNIHEWADPFIFKFLDINKLKKKLEIAKISHNQLIFEIQPKCFSFLNKSCILCIHLSENYFLNLISSSLSGISHFS